MIISFTLGRIFGEYKRRKNERGGEDEKVWSVEGGEGEKGGKLDGRVFGGGEDGRRALDRRGLVGGSDGGGDGGDGEGRGGADEQPGGEDRGGT